MTRRFILCLGASKSGTTWFYSFLKTQASVYPGLRKEFGILDKIFELPSVVTTPPSIRIDSELSRKLALRQAQLEKMSLSLENYVDYFDDLIGAGGFSMDVSPRYLQISTGDLEKVVAAFNARNIETIIVVLLRDPVERLISFGKMVQRDRFIRKKLLIQNYHSLIEIVTRLLQSREFAHDYVSAVRNVGAVQGGAQKLIIPFENAVTPDGYACLAASLKLEAINGFEKKIIHAARADESWNDIDVDALRRLLSDQYEGCLEYFEKTGIAPQWRFL